jgi:hypothetical protein
VCVCVCEREREGGGVCNRRMEKVKFHISGFQSLHSSLDIKMLKSRRIGWAGPVVCGKDEMCIQNFRQNLAMSNRIALTHLLPHPTSSRTSLPTCRLLYPT